MANIKQQKKRNKQALVARERNKSVRSELKTRMRRVKEAAAEGDGTKAADAAQKAQSAYGVAARKGVIHKNAMARKQRQAAKLANEANA